MSSYWKAQLTEHSFQVENCVATSMRWPSDFISSCQTSAVLFVVTYAGEGWRLKLIGGQQENQLTPFKRVQPLPYLGLLAVSANFTSLVDDISIKLILKSEVRWIQEMSLYFEIIPSG